MEIVCRQCAAHAFRILPELVRGIVTAECVICGTLTLIEVPRPSPAEKDAANYRCRPANDCWRTDALSGMR